jgi:DNA polymerase-1
MDCAATLDIWERIDPDLDELSQRVYDFERTLQNATMTVQLRGMRVDEDAAARGIGVLEEQAKKAEAAVRELANWHVGWEPNIQSTPQLVNLLYGPKKVLTCKLCGGKGQYQDGHYKNGNEKWVKCKEKHYFAGLGQPERKNRKTGNAAVGIEQLEAIMEQQKEDSAAYRMVEAILSHRDAKKQLDFLTARRSHDGRMRASFNVGATDTLRLSSSQNVFREGLNFQNVTKRRRNIFVPDPGYRMVNIDFAQGESHIVAYLSGDLNYIKVHTDPEWDTHTGVAKLVWPDADWPDDPHEARKMAEVKNFYRHFSRRDLSKRIQHAMNYVGSKYTVSRTLHIPMREADEIIARYFSAFPGIKDWHTEVRRELRGTGALVAPPGYRRQFFDRLWDDSTAKQAVAHLPQSMLAVICHLAFYRIWRDLDNGDPMQPGTGDLELLAHGHDAVLAQVKEGREDLIKAMRDLMYIDVPMPHRRTMRIGVDVEVGRNWRDLKGYHVTA